MEGKALNIDGSGWAMEFRRVGDKRKAITIMGWGHLVCPFYGPRSGGARLRTQASGAVLTRGGRAAAADSARRCRRVGPPEVRRASFRPENREKNTRPGYISQVLL